MSRKIRSARPSQGLTPKEEKVLFFLAQGWSDGEIAKEMSISHGNVATCIGRLICKRFVNSREELVQKLRKTATKDEAPLPHCQR